MTVETIQPQISLQPNVLEFKDKVVSGKPYQTPEDITVGLRLPA